MKVKKSERAKRDDSTTPGNEKRPDKHGGETRRKQKEASKHVPRHSSVNRHGAASRLATYTSPLITLKARREEKQRLETGDRSVNCVLEKFPRGSTSTTWFSVVC